MAGMWLVGEDMPQENNRITLEESRVCDIYKTVPPNPARLMYFERPRVWLCDGARAARFFRACNSTLRFCHPG
jgi:hypothetical protein